MSMTRRKRSTARSHKHHRKKVYMREKKWHRMMRTIPLGFWYAEYKRWRKRDILRESHLSIKAGRRRHFYEETRL